MNAIETSVKSGSEPSVLTKTERIQLQLELDRVIDRMTVLLPQWKAPFSRGVDDPDFESRHLAICDEVKKLCERRDYLQHWLDIGIDPKFEEQLRPGRRVATDHPMPITSDGRETKEA